MKCLAFRPLFTSLCVSLLAVATGCSDDGVVVPAEPQPTETSCTPFGEENLAAATALAEQAATAEDGPFFMLNLVKFRELACYEDGRETELTGKEADELYAPIEFLTAIGAKIRFVAPVEATLLGDGVVWDQVAIVEYPSAAAFLSMVSDPEFQARAVHKRAGVEKTIVMVSQLMPSMLPEDYVPPESPYPATEEDPPVEVVHVLKFRDQAIYPEGTDFPAATGEEAVAKYSAAAGEVALPLGVYPSAWFAVEDVLIGDGRTWDEFRINHMPSHAAFQALVNDPARLEAQVHRDAGLEDTYTVLADPFIHTLDPIAGD